MHAFLHVHDYKCDTCILCIHIYRYSSIYVSKNIDDCRDLMYTVDKLEAKGKFLMHWQE